MSTVDRAQSYANAFFEAAFERWLGTLAGAAQALSGSPTLRQQLQAADVDFSQRQARLAGLLPADARRPDDSTCCKR